MTPDILFTGPNGLQLWGCSHDPATVREHRIYRRSGMADYSGPVWVHAHTTDGSVAAVDYIWEQLLNETPRRTRRTDDFQESETGAPESEWDWNAQHSDPAWP